MFDYNVMEGSLFISIIVWLVGLGFISLISEKIRGYYLLLSGYFLSFSYHIEYL